MATIQKAISIPLTSTNANIIAGSQFEFAVMNQLINLGFKAEATGLKINIFLNDQLLAEDLEPAIGAAATTKPVMPDDYPVTNEGMLAGDRLTIRVQNTTGAAVILNYAVNITPA
jgi:hypothetical protein